MVLPALVALLAIVNVGCSMAATTRNDASAQPDRTVRVRAGDFGTEITVRVGDVLRIERPADYDEWNLAYSTDVLRSLNTAQGQRRPPADGWTFAVVAAGTTDISLTPVVPRGGTPNVPKFVVTVSAR